MTFLASNPDISDTIAQYTAAFSDNCFLFAVVALVIYDGVATLWREVQLFWGAETRSLPAVLYSMPSILVSHFLLDLQEAHQKTSVGLATDDTLLPMPTGLEGMEVERRSINVADTFGSLSIIIDPADWDDDHDDGGVDYPLATFDASPSPDEGGAAN